MTRAFLLATPAHADDIGVYSIIPKKTLPNKEQKNTVYDVSLSTEKINSLVLEYTSASGGIDIYVSKHDGNLLQSDEDSTITPIEIPSYGAFKLVSQNGEDEYYSIVKETDELAIRINYYTKDMNESGFSKEAMIELVKLILT